MKALLLLTTLFVLITNALGQRSCNIQEHYGSFISASVFKLENRSILVKQLNRVDSSLCYSKLVNTNASYIDYLLTHFSSSSYDDELAAESDSVRRQSLLLRHLQQDSMFNKVMAELADKSLSKTIAKDTVSMDQMLNIAVKYFTIIAINEKGAYVGKICTGTNAIEGTEKTRKPQLEAFCFSSILENYQSEQFNMLQEFTKAIKDVYTINLGLDQSERLLRAQGAIFLLMKHSNVLTNMLRAEYEKRRDVLPFVLIEK